MQSPSAGRKQAGLARIHPKYYLCTAFRALLCGSVTEWKGLSRGVMVAQQVLVLFVKVRILARQQRKREFRLPLFFSSPALAIIHLPRWIWGEA